MIRTLARLALGYAAVVEGSAAMIRFREREAAYKAAFERASVLGRTLVVVGDPDAGFHTRLIRAYGCGDVCLDLNGCPQCPVSIVADVTKPLPFPDDSAVVFVACVLEYVTDPKAAAQEFRRIAGSPSNVFTVFVQPWTLTARLYPNAKWRATSGLDRSRAPGEMTRVDLDDKLFASVGLGLVLAAAFWPEQKKR